MCLHESAKTEYISVHMVHNNIMALAYNILCKKFNKVFKATDCVKILKTLDVTQIKLVLIGDLPKAIVLLGQTLGNNNFQILEQSFPKQPQMK